MDPVIVINIDPVLIYGPGPIAIRWYGLMYVVGITAGLLVAIPYAVRWCISAGQVLSTVNWAFIFGLLGGRLYYVVQQPLEPFLAEPWRIIAVWEGGMAFFGAIFGVMIGLAIGARQAGIPYWRLVDTGAIFATVGQAFGRIGNVINGDIVGYPTNPPWGFVYTHPNSFAPVKGIAYQPAPLYEIMANIIILAILWPLRFRLRTPGMLFAVYLASYSVSQFIIFFWRANEVVALGLKQAQLTSVVVLIAAAGLAWYLHRRRPDPLPEPAAG